MTQIRKNEPSLGRRVVVIGTTGSGKTTLARQLGAYLGVPHTELDALNWEPHWTCASPELFRARVDAMTSADGWTTEGNYSKVRDLVWSRADTVIWLDYSFPVTFTRLLTRTVRRIVRREELWNGNRETFGKTFCSRESILVWLFQTYGKRKRETPEILARPEYAHLTVFHFHTPRQTAEWLATVTCQV